MSDKIVKNVFGSGHDLHLDEFYYISYPDQKEQLTKKQWNDRYGRYSDISRWPETALKHKALAELSPEQNPNYIKITGRMILVWAEQGFVPQFDKYFEQTRRLIMIPIDAWDFFNQHSAMLKK